MYLVHTYTQHARAYIYNIHMHMYKEYLCMCQCVSMHSGFQLPIVINSVLSRVLFTPTVQHCSMATVIGLCVRVQLLRCLPSRFKVIAIPSGRLIHFVKIEQISCYILPSYQTNVFFYFHILYSW